MGFTEATAAKIIQLYSSELTRESPLYWADRWLESFVHYYPKESLSATHAQIPASWRNGTFYTQIIFGRKFTGGGDLPLQDKDLPNLEACVDIRASLTKGGRFLFHGTKLDHAWSILQTGIRVDKGRNNQDFSHGDGFYLSCSIGIASQWSDLLTNRGKGQRALLVYFIEQSELDHMGPDYHIFPNANQPWKDLVKHCRQGDATQPKLYEGPMCENGQNVRDFDHEPKPHNPAKNQLCVRTAPVASVFNLHLVFVFVW